MYTIVLGTRTLVLAVLVVAAALMLVVAATWGVGQLGR
jgi:hypothetical protein